MVDLKQSVPRRGFIGGLATGAAALGLSTLIAPFRSFAEPKHPPLQSNNSEFDAWLGKIKGTHKQVFDSPFPDGGLPLAWARVFLMTNAGVGVATDDMCSVLVLRHDSIPFALPDPLWAKYKLGEEFKINDGATKSPAVRNPFYNPKPGELPLPDMSVGDLLKSGVLIGVCDMALTIYSGKIAKQMNMDGAEVKKEWVAGVFPGIQIVPSGVLAINRAQQRGCTYCFAG